MSNHRNPFDKVERALAQGAANPPKELGPVGDNRGNPLQSKSKAVKDFHDFDDVDSNPKAHHHTLGDGAGQAANGAHVAKIKQQILDHAVRLDAHYAELEERAIQLTSLQDQVSALEARVTELENG